MVETYMIPLTKGKNKKKNIGKKAKLNKYPEVGPQHGTKVNINLRDLFPQ